MVTLLGDLIETSYRSAARPFPNNPPRQPLTDSELLRAACKNAPEACNTLSRRYFPSVWRYAYALLNDIHTAEDVVSETMLAFLETVVSLQTIRRPFGAAQCAGSWWFSRGVVFALHAACLRQSAH